MYTNRRAELLPLIHAISTKIMCAGPYIVGNQLNCHGEIILLNVQSYKHTKRHVLISSSTLSTLLAVYNTVQSPWVQIRIVCAPKIAFISLPIILNMFWVLKRTVSLRQLF